MTTVTPADDDPSATPAVTFADALAVWLRIGLLSFGGPAAQIGLMHREVVEQRGWLTERQYLNALNFCMLLPGPEAMQLATYAGWRLHGVAGGLAAGLAFVLPGAAVVLVLAMIYAAFGNVPLVEALFLGIKAAVLVIVVEALLRIAKRALAGAEAWMLAGLAFVGIFFLALPYPLIVLAAALYGFARGASLARRGAPGADAATATPPVHFTGSARTTAVTALVCLAIWLVPLLALGWALGFEHKLAQLGFFFSKLAVVTFGGAYAVLAYMGQDVVTRLGWLETGQMMDGLGLAETTPGPLILVTEFVGYVAAWKDGGFALGLAGAGVTLWATFAPCFLWIFTAAPYVDWINAQPRLKGALDAITAAVVGVIANLGLWFGLHVFFGRVDRVAAGPFVLWTPEFATLDWRVVLLAGISGILLLGRRWSVPAVLAVAASLGLVVTFGVNWLA